MLYTQEFFETVKQHLNPGGAVTLFVQLYESNTAAVKSEIATFLEAFPNGVVWGNTNNGAGYDLVLLGQVGADEDRRRRGAGASSAARRMAPVAQSLREIGMNSAVDLFSTYAGRRATSQPWLEDATHQPRPQPAAAVPGRDGPQPVSERSDLLRTCCIQPLSRGAVRRIRSHQAGAPGRHPEDAGEIGVSTRCGQRARKAHARKRST